MKHFLITGGSGVVGGAIVGKLLEQPDTVLTLLLRASSQHALEEKRAAILAFLEIDAESSRAARVRACRGDVTCSSFGLPDPEYQRLTREVTHLIHAAGNVKLNTTLAEARRDAVVSAERVAAFVKAARRAGPFQKAEILSTVGVAGRRRGLLPEKLLHERRAFRNSYEQAKAECEQYLERALFPHAPATIHRLSMVVGDSLGGRIRSFQVFYYLCEFLAGRLTGGAVPRLASFCVDLVPVDFVAALIAWSAGTTATAGHVLHACSGPARSLPLEELTALCRAQFSSVPELPPLRRLPVAVFRCRLAWLRFRDRAVRRRTAVVPHILEYVKEPQSFDCRRTHALAREAGISLPESEKFMPQVLRYYLERTLRSAGE